MRFLRLNLSVGLLALFFVVILVGCAGTSGAQTANKAVAAKKGKRMSAGARLRQSDELEKLISGLKDFESRARGFDSGQWNFVLGYAHFRKGKWKEAAPYFARAAGKLPKLSDHILYYRAVSAERRGKYDQALGFLDILEADYPDSVWAGPARLERARALMGVGRYDEAKKCLEEYREQDRDHDHLEVPRLLVHLLIESGDATGAVAMVKSLAVRASCEAELLELKSLIDKAGRFGVNISKWLDEPAQQYRLAQSFVDYSQWDEAAARLEVLLEREDLDGQTSVRAKWLLAQCKKWLHQYDEAIGLMEGLLRDPGAAGLVQGVAGTLATTYAKKNDYTKAIALRRRIIKQLPARSRVAASLTFKIAFLYMDQGKYDKAIPLWRQVIGMRLTRRQRAQAKWYLAWCHYKGGEKPTALALFDELLKKEAKRSRIENRVLYWRGRLLEQMGSRGEARALFRRILRSHPTGYYAELARRRLEGRKVDAKNFANVKWMGVGKSTWKPSDVPLTGGPPHMARAQALDRLGLHEEVARELRFIDLKANPDLYERILWLASRNYDYNLALKIANGHYHRELKARALGQDGFGRFMWEMSYPKAYSEAVERWAKIWGLDPLFIWSVMRTESAFQPKAISSAGAVGLMQLMPTTANRMARESIGRSVDQRDLNRPALNIALGVEYLAKLVELFPGNPVAPIAAYNAGEEAVGRWIENGSMDDIEEWIEEIPYAETNLYVKKVLKTYWILQGMYRR